jgi:hypothetical protein
MGRIPYVTALATSLNRCQAEPMGDGGFWRAFGDLSRRRRNNRHRLSQHLENNRC